MVVDTPVTVRRQRWTVLGVNESFKAVPLLGSSGTGTELPSEKSSRAEVIWSFRFT